MKHWCLLQTSQELRGCQKNATFEKLQVKFLDYCRSILSFRSDDLLVFRFCFNFFSVYNLCKKKETPNPVTESNLCSFKLCLWFNLDAILNWMMTGTCFYDWRKILLQVINILFV